MIPADIRIKDGALPETPGVYLMKDEHGTILYVGKATSLKRRVRQHFERPHSTFIEEMTQKVREIDYIQKPTAMEALILEANLIKLYWPKYNTDQKDDKSFLYLAITDELYPRPVLVRGSHIGPGNTLVGVTIRTSQGLSGKNVKGGVIELAKADTEHMLKYSHLFGPYTSTRALRMILEYIRRVIPWSTCTPGQKRACFYVHINQCPGVCIEKISPRDYKKIIRDLIKLFEGKKEDLIKRYRKEMERASREQRFEEAVLWRNRVYALEHIKDVAMLSRDDEDEPAPKSKEARIFGRIEGYDISHVSGTSMVASMVVFERGAPAKAEYRKFRIKTVEGSNDVASMQEVLRRRFTHSEWRMPDLLLIDGGLPQVHAAQAVLDELQLTIPMIGIAKGPERKRNDLVYSSMDTELLALCEKHHTILEQVRDEAHRFAIAFHRMRRSKDFLRR